MGYFLDDSENFENLDFFWTYYWSFLGPWTPYFWLFWHQITSKNIRKYMGTSWENIIFPCLTNNIFEKKRKANPPFVLDFIFVYFVGIYFLIIYFVNHILRRWGIENDSFSINKIHKSLNMNLVSIKNMNYFPQNESFLHFRARKSLSPINVPIPTPASPASDFCTRC